MISKLGSFLAARSAALSAFRNAYAKTASLLGLRKTAALWNEGFVRDMARYLATHDKDDALKLVNTRWKQRQALLKRIRDAKTPADVESLMRDAADDPDLYRRLKGVSTLDDLEALRREMPLFSLQAGYEHPVLAQIPEQDMQGVFNQMRLSPGNDGVRGPGIVISKPSNAAHAGKRHVGELSQEAAERRTYEQYRDYMRKLRRVPLAPDELASRNLIEIGNALEAGRKGQLNRIGQAVHIGPNERSPKAGFVDVVAGIPSADLDFPYEVLRFNKGLTADIAARAGELGQVSAVFEHTTAYNTTANKFNNRLGLDGSLPKMPNITETHMNDPRVPRIYAGTDEWDKAMLLADAKGYDKFVAGRTVVPSNNAKKKN